MDYSIGIDIGSTTVKLVIAKNGETVFRLYERHFSQVREKAAELLEKALAQLGDITVKAALSGSAAMGLAEASGIPFVQEVFATGQAVKAFAPETTCAIELGGEDAKIIFFDGGMDERMNGSCAGGTGAFIDQMATLLNVTTDELDKLSLKYDKIYPIASRCGVFAKSDIQPLLNQGARKEDIAASIYQAVVNQTIAGLAQGRRIEGNVIFLGGPLYYCEGLRRRFRETLNLDEQHATLPDYARFSVALGASMYASSSGIEASLSHIIELIHSVKSLSFGTNRLDPLFNSEKEYEAFKKRHEKAKLTRRDINKYSGKAYLGIDCGSTTTKLALIGEDCSLLYTYYSSNEGSPVDIVKSQLENVYSLCGERIVICGSAVTGYGEELIENAFGVSCGVVETIAHYRAAEYFRPDVDFILDIGGQDIKCFRIKNRAIDSIFLNEACSSGCGSFLETFAKSLGYSIADFARLGLFAQAPVNLGSRCTVFMNSSVKQSQKEGATVSDISAGLSISVVKNALYKVIRVSSAQELGKNIVVQGGTFYNDAVLRAFEKELGCDVIRPDISGLMGAFGAALYAKSHPSDSLIGPEEIANFKWTAAATVCHGCTNHCHLTISTFPNGKRFISGNQCQRFSQDAAADEDLPNLYEYKRRCLSVLPRGTGSRGTIGLPMSLGMYELLPLWNGIFTHLGFSAIISDPSTRATYEKGQFTIPSDTACYPAKLMHGHIEELLEQKPDAIFYPCLTYNIDEHSSDNHYNCPVVAYYSELLSGNIEELKNTRFLHPYLNVNKPKELARELHKVLNSAFGKVFKRSEIYEAVMYGFSEYQRYMEDVRRHGREAIKEARRAGKRIMILAGRPYHIDPEICHGIDKLANSLGFAVVTEDSVCSPDMQTPNVGVLNQWTYHSRLYKAAMFAAQNRDVELVQMVSFGCGVDAITTDEVRFILESRGKLYTQLKIDEITNLGAVKIRLRSLLGAIEERENRYEQGLCQIYRGDEVDTHASDPQHAAISL